MGAFSGTFSFASQLWLIKDSDPSASPSPRRLARATLDGMSEAGKQMGIPEDPNERRDWIVKAWKRYAEEFNVFVPDEQPTPKGDAWGRSLPEATEDGTIDPQFLKHRRFLHHTKAFLRQRYVGVRLDICVFEGADCCEWH